MCFIEKGVLRNFKKFTGKHLWQGLFLNKVAGLCCKMAKHALKILQCEIELCIWYHIEHLPTTASVSNFYFFYLPEIIRKPVVVSSLSSLLVHRFKDHKKYIPRKSDFS